MPDIVFQLLFFFMVTATIKTNENLLNVSIPNAQAINAVEKKFLVKELHVGFLKDGKYGKTPKISADDRIIDLDQVGLWVEQQRANLGDNNQDQMIVMLKADKHVDMGIIGDIQTELRRHSARKILYRTLENF